MRPQGRALTGCDAPAGASGAQPAPLYTLPHPSTIMENYCSVWPLQVSTWARASSHASTARHAQWKAWAAIDEPL